MCAPCLTNVRQTSYDAAMPRITLRLDDDDIRMLDQVAHAEGITRSAAARRLIRAHEDADELPERVRVLEQRLDDLEQRARVGF